MPTLQCYIGNTELLNLYGYEPYLNSTVATRWHELAVIWHATHSRELAHLRQMMLIIHKDLCPDDERWR